MADPSLAFDPVTGWEDTTTFVTNPANQAATRTLFQRLFTQIQTFLNTTLVTWVNDTFATKADLAATVLGTIADGSLTDAKMVADAQNGSNAALTTTSKTNKVSAINELVTSIAAIVSGLADYATKDEDIGKIEYFAMTTAPARRLECKGQDVSRTTYSKLFTAIGTTFGVGDGATTFTLPDLRGVVPRGWDNGRGYDVARVFGSYQADGNATHTHTGTTDAGGAHTHTVTTYQSASNTAGAARGNNVDPGSATTSTSSTHTHTITTAASGNTEATVKNVALLACIKY